MSIEFFPLRFVFHSFHTRDFSQTQAASAGNGCIKHLSPKDFIDLKKLTDRARSGKRTPHRSVFVHTKMKNEDNSTDLSPILISIGRRLDRIKKKEQRAPAQEYLTDWTSKISFYLQHTVISRLVRLEGKTIH